MRKEWIWVTVATAAVMCLFFYKTVFFGLVPFPGDSLMSDFQPWRSSSYGGYAPGGVPSKAQYPDVSRQLYPWRTLVVDALKQGKLPLWNPYSFAGSPLLANFQSAALYPLNVLYVAVSHIDGWSILVMLQPFLAILFTYWYLRIVGGGPLGSAMAALSFGFSGFMAVWLEYNTVGHVIVWLPLILLSVERLRHKPIARWLGILTFAHTASIFAGHPQVYAYVLIFSSVYTFFRVAPFMRWYIGGFSILGIGIAGLQILPGLELIANAARSPHDPGTLFSKILIQPLQLLSLPFPNIFGNPATRTYWPADTFVGKVTTIGLVPLFFVFSAIRRNDAVTRWFLGASLVTLLLITANPVTFLLYRIPIPLITSSSPTLMSFLFAFSLSVLCGLGLDYWITDKHSMRKLMRRSIEVACIFAALFVLGKIPVTNLSQHAPVLNRALIYGALVTTATLMLFFIAIRLKRYRTHAVTVLLVVHALDLFMFFSRFNPFVPKTFVFPDHPVLDFLSKHAPDRYWGFGTANIPANFSAQYGIFSPEGYDPLYLSWYGSFLYSFRDGRFLTSFDNRTRSDAAIASSFGDGGLSDAKKHKLLSALSVRYVLDRVENGSTSETFPPKSYKKVYETGEWRIYENLDAVPRAYLVSGVSYAETSGEFTDLFYSASFNPGSDVILPAMNATPVISASAGSAAIRTITPETVEVVTDSTSSGLLVLTDTYEPGWQAYVDGVYTDIYPANYVFRGVPVPRGRHTVRFEYRPTSVVNGAVFSIISIGVSCIGILIIRKKFS